LGGFWPDSRTGEEEEEEDSAREQEEETWYAFGYSRLFMHLLMRMRLRMALDALHSKTFLLGHFQTVNLRAGCWSQLNHNLPPRPQ